MADYPRKSLIRQPADRRQLACGGGSVACCLLAAAIIVPEIVGTSHSGPGPQSDLTAIKGMLEHFRLDCGRYPTTSEGLNALRTAPTGLAKAWKGPYADKPIELDAWRNPYLYKGHVDRFELKSYGSDVRPGGEGEAADLQSTE